MRAIVPIASWYERDNTILDGLYIAGFTKAELIEHFLLSYGDLTPLYSNPDYIKRHVTSVAKALKWSIDKLYNITQLEYNPIENYDRHEDWTDKHDGKFDKGQIDSTGMYQKGMISDTMGGTQDTTHSVAAYNADTAQLADTDHTVTNSNETQTFGADNSSASETHGSDLTDNLDTHHGYIHGNIGTMTTQQMIEEEYQLARLNYLDDVCKLYSDHLLIGVW